MHRVTAKKEDAQLLAAANAVPVAKPIRYAHLWKVTKTYDDAFEFDPLVLYIKAGVKPPRAATKAQNLATFLRWKGRKIMLTVNGGRAFIVTCLDLEKPRMPFEHLFDFLAARILDIFASKPTAEQQKRSEEFNTKIQSLITETIGDRVPDMISIYLLATEPASQGRGYGSALVEAVNNMADLRGKASYLLAITANEPFYNFHGYNTVGTLYMGESNPNWDQKPIAVHLMVREAQNKPETPPSKKSSKAFDLNSILNSFQSLI